MPQLFGDLNNWDRVPGNPTPHRKLSGKKMEARDTKFNRPNRRAIKNHVPVFLRHYFLREPVYDMDDAL